MAKPRRGLPEGYDIEPFEEADLEVTMVRRVLAVEAEQEDLEYSATRAAPDPSDTASRTPRRASRNLADPGDASSAATGSRASRRATDPDAGSRSRRASRVFVDDAPTSLSIPRFVDPDESVPVEPVVKPERGVSDPQRTAEAGADRDADTGQQPADTDRAEEQVAVAPSFTVVDETAEPLDADVDESDEPAITVVDDPAELDAGIQQDATPMAAADEAADAETRPAAEPKTGKKPRFARRRLVAAVLATFVMVAGLIAASIAPAQQPPAPDTVPLVTALTRVCPMGEHGELRTVGDNIDITEVGGAAVIRPVDPHGIAVGATQFGEGAGIARCVSNRADQYVHVPMDENASVYVINANESDALVDITLSGPNGVIEGPGLRGVTLQAGETFNIKLADYFEEPTDIGVRVRATLGRVVAYALYGDGGVTNLTEFGTSIVIPGIPADADSVTLITTNPATQRVDVSIDTITEAGTSQIEDGARQVLNATRTEIINLDQDITSSDASIHITSEEPIAASALVDVGDHTFVVSGINLSHDVDAPRWVGVLPATGYVIVTNPYRRDVNVTVEWGDGQAPASLKIPAGQIDTIEIPAGAVDIHLESDLMVTAQAISTEPLDIYPLTATAVSEASIPLQPAPGFGR